MQISLSHTTETEAQLTIVANEAELKTIKDQILARFQKQVRIAGFREGKAPLAMVEKNIDESTFQTEFIEEAINQMYLQALNQEKLRPVDNPKVDIKKFVPFTTLEFVADVPVIGKVTLPDYKKVKKTKPEVKVTAEDVKEVVKSLQTRMAERKDVDRAAKDTDTVYIDFKGTDTKGEAVNGAEGTDYPLTLGSKTFIPGFEENVVGMKPGEEKSFELTFPKDYNVKALANKKVTFAVTATKVQEASEPKADDEFAAKVGPFKTLDDLKADIKTQLTAEREAEASRAFENDLMKELAAKSKVALPKAMVDREIAAIEQEEKQNLLYRGQTWEEHLAEEGVNAEEHAEQKRPVAEERVKIGLMLSEVSEKEGLDVEADELDLRMQLLQGQYTDPKMQAELHKPEARRDIASRILTEKTVAKLVEYATSK